MILTDVVMKVWPQEDYHYEVTVGEILTVTYIETDGDERYISFGSIEEMRAVATAMMNACSAKAQMK